MDTLGPANFVVILLLCRGCPPSQVTLCYHGSSVGTIEFVLCREVRCSYIATCVIYSDGPLREVPL